MKVLLFGGSGFLGKSIVSYFNSKITSIETVSRGKNCDFQININSFEDFNKLPNNYYDIVINAATILPGGNYLDNHYLNEIYETNILGSQNICKWVQTQQSIKTIINCSTLAVVNKPWEISLNEAAKTYPLGNHVLYSSSKLMQELLFTTFCDFNKLRCVHLRFSSIYGENMAKSGILFNLFTQINSNSFVEITNGSKISFDFIHVEDAAKVIFEVIKSKSRGIINVASGNEIKLLNLTKKIAHLYDKPININNFEDELFEDNFSKIDISKLNQIIKTSDFVSLENGLKQIIAVWK